MICTYCKTDQEQENICLICGADLEQKRPQMKQMLNQEEAYQSQPILVNYHTYDLLLFLRHIRADRTDMYKTMQTVRKAPQEAKNNAENYESIKDDGIKMYRKLTAQKNVIEQILIDRMGYYPKRIDDKLLEALENKIKGIK